MSKLLENKQLLHIASEVIILVSLVYYINKKNKKLMGYIEELVQRLEEQEDIINRHEQIIKTYIISRSRPDSEIPFATQSVNTQSVNTQSVNTQPPKSKVVKQKNTEKIEKNDNKKLNTQRFKSEPTISEEVFDVEQEVTKNVIIFTQPSLQPVAEKNTQQITSYIEELDTNSEKLETSTNLDEELKQELEELDE